MRVSGPFVLNASDQRLKAPAVTREAEEDWGGAKLMTARLLCCFSTPQPQQLKVLSHPGFVGSLFAAFDLLRSWRHDHAAMLCAFDLIEVDGKDLRSGPIEERKHVLAEILHPERKAIVFNVHYDCDGATIFEHACALGCEGIVSKRLGSPYRSGRSAHWVKVKNPKAPAITREAEEDWGR
jgi:hypothetical protein